MSETITWRGWRDPAFALAAGENKPILLSLVTAWSQECAAMDRTTFADPQVVGLVARHFVPVRVDADRRPDLNERYNLGGWPTTAFLTADGEVLSGGTYFAPEEMAVRLAQVSEAWRARSAEIRTRATATRTPGRGAGAGSRPDRSAVSHLKAVLIANFDPAHGGFGTSPKLPHTSAIMLALSLAPAEPAGPDGELADIVEITLDKLSALWDPEGGGFYRYADGEDWSDPGAEKTLEDNAALLHVYVEAAMRRQSDEFPQRAAQIVRWVKAALSDPADGGFYNAQSGDIVDRSLYVDRNADMAAALLRAAALFDDPWLRDFALKSLETVVLRGYRPGGGTAHVASPGDPEPVTGLLTDQIRVASALIWAHAVTERLPYSMLAAELMQFAIRTMWDEQADGFRDRASIDQRTELGLLRESVMPFALNCEAACVLDRLATLTGDRSYHDRAVAILGTFASEYRQHDLFGAPYALAVREIVERCPPLGLELDRVDWHLGTDAG
jgi:uncharacterized protein YyaL (SSP411 family)